MLSADRFAKYRPAPDPFQSDVKLELDDLDPVIPGEEAPLAVFISTWNRMAQLARSLECLARQEFTGFTVYLNDDGSEQNISRLADKFSPYLRIKYRRAARDGWRSCPSSAYRAFLDDGWLDPGTETIAIMHPEIMLPPNGTKLLHFMHSDPHMVRAYGPIPGKKVYPNPITFESNTGYWVTLQPLFVDPARQGLIDHFDWHSDLRNLHKLPGFWTAPGFAGRTNGQWRDWGQNCPWWFAASAKADDPIWRDLPVTRGHATIDMYLITYRRFGRMMDLTPAEVFCYHQAHAVSAVSPIGENTEDNLHGKELGMRRASDYLDNNTRS